MSGFRFRPFRTQPRRLSRMYLGRGFVTNNPPTITVPGTQSATSNVATSITGTSIADTDGNTQTVTLTVSHGTMTLASTTGLSFSAGDGTADATMTFSGSVTNINTAIATITYTSTTDYVGADSLAISTNDGAGGTDSDSIAITVTWTPASLTTNLVAWFDPSYGTYEDAGTDPTEVLDPLYQWNARAGTGSVVVLQATLANRPIVNQAGNGKYYHTYNGTASYLAATSTSAANLTGDFTLAAMFNVTNISGDRSILSKQKTAANYNGYSLGRIGGKAAVEVSDGTYTIKSGTTTITGSMGWKSMLAKRASTTATVYFDGTSEGSGAVQGGDTSFAVALNIGRYTGISSYFVGDIGHIVIMSDDISDAQRALLQTFFTSEVPA